MASDMGDAPPHTYHYSVLRQSLWNVFKPIAAVLLGIVVAFPRYCLAHCRILCYVDHVGKGKEHTCVYCYWCCLWPAYQQKKACQLLFSVGRDTKQFLFLLPEKLAPVHSLCSDLCWVHEGRGEMVATDRMTFHSIRSYPDGKKMVNYDAEKKVVN